MDSPASTAQASVPAEQQLCPCKRYSMVKQKATIVLGSQWGDEGKGKVVDMLAVNSDIVCRCQVYIFL